MNQTNAVIDLKIQEGYSVRVPYELVENRMVELGLDNVDEYLEKYTHGEAWHVVERVELTDEQRRLFRLEYTFDQLDMDFAGDMKNTVDGATFYGVQALANEYKTVGEVIRAFGDAYDHIVIPNIEGGN